MRKGLRAGGDRGGGSGPPTPCSSEASLLSRHQTGQGNGNQKQLGIFRKESLNIHFFLIDISKYLFICFVLNRGKRYVAAATPGLESGAGGTGLQADPGFRLWVEPLSFQGTAITAPTPILSWIGCIERK